MQWYPDMLQLGLPPELKAPRRLQLSGLLLVSTVWHAHVMDL